MLNEQQFEQSGLESLQLEQPGLPQSVLDQPDDALVAEAAQGAEGELAELSESDLDNVAGGFSMGDLSSFFQGASSNFSETNVFFEQTSFAGPNGAGGKTTLIFQSIDSSNTQIAGGTV